MNSEFWRGKRVLLTGHTGFKGGWLSLWLQSMGVNLIGYSLPPPTNPSFFKLAKVDLFMESVNGDIRDLENLMRVFKEFQPEVVFHMAAQPLVRYSYIKPVETYSTNVMGTVHLLEAVRLTPSVRAVVNITTDKCYENREWVWGYRENEPMGGFDPYSNSKGCAELVSSAYQSSFFNSEKYPLHRISLATVRAGNVIGGGDWAQDRLIPDILSAFEDGRTVNIRNPYAIRPWQHVLEPLSGYLTLAELLYEKGPSFAGGWNFGPNEEDAQPVSWIVEKMASMWGSNATWKIDTQDHPHEAHYLKLDISKARTRLNWTPKLRLINTLELIINWTQQRLNGVDMRKYSLAQLDSYQALTN